MQNSGGLSDFDQSEVGVAVFFTTTLSLALPVPSTPHSSSTPILLLLSKTLTPKKHKPSSALLQWNHKPKLFGSTPYIAVITSNKGSVGKTTTTASFDLSLACLGFSIVVIVANIGLRNLDLLLDLDNHANYTLIEVLNDELVQHFLCLKRRIDVTRVKKLGGVY
ncbi:putative septum site-determining protein minD, chloroplastic [Glycine max]|nr:putative septum site-determining protein minD, chloroplastic [Glycine max]